MAAHGANLASDKAANYTNASWTSGSNEGSGFGAWSFSQNAGGGAGDSGHFLGDSGEGDPSFALFSGGNDGAFLSSADRPFTGGALTAGQTFEIDLGHSALIDDTNPGDVGINLTDSGATGTDVVFTLKFVGGTTNWIINDGGSDFNINQGFAANTSIAFSFTYEGGSNYSYTFGTASGSNFTANNTISGIDGFRLFTNNQGGGENFGADNPAIVPEPSSCALLFGVAGLTLAMIRRRR